jgi:hypothetical protein
MQTTQIQNAERDARAARRAAERDQGSFQKQAEWQAANNPAFE